MTKETISLDKVIATLSNPDQEKLIRRIHNDSKKVVQGGLSTHLLISYFQKKLTKKNEI